MSIPRPLDLCGKAAYVFRHGRREYAPGVQPNIQVNDTAYGQNELAPFYEIHTIPYEVLSF